MRFASSFIRCVGALALLLVHASAQAAYTITGGPGPAPINSTTPNADYAQLDNIMTQFMLKANVPNAQLAVGYGDKIIYTRGYTASTAERPLRVNVTTDPTSPNVYSEPPYKPATTQSPAEPYMTTQPNTRFRVASLSKLVTGLAIQQLVLDGKLSLSEPAYAILREEAGSTLPASPADSRMTTVTVKHLLNHEAGFDRNLLIYSTAACSTYPSPTPCEGHPAGQPRHIVKNPDPVGRVKPMPNEITPTSTLKTCKEMLDSDLGSRILHYTPGAPPQVSGAYFQFYTNIAYCWAERVIAIRAGAGYTGYEDYVQKRVLQPAGIAYASLASADNRDRLQPGDASTAEINQYYDQPGSYLAYAWCDVYARSPTCRVSSPAPPTSARATTVEPGAGCFQRRNICACCKVRSSGYGHRICSIFRVATQRARTASSPAPRSAREHQARTIGRIAIASAPASPSGASRRATRCSDTLLPTRVA